MHKPTDTAWTRRTLSGALAALTMVAALVMATPSATAQPGVPPPPPAPPVGPLPPAPPPPPPPPVAPLPPGPAELPPPPPPGAPLPPPPPAFNPFAPRDAPPPAGTVAGQNPLPYTGTPPFRPPTFNPVNGAMVGVAKPIIINFAVPIADRPLAESAVHISSVPPVPGKFYWMSDTQLRWRPIDFWPKDTVVTIDAAGTKSSFRVGDSLVATIDDSTHMMEIVKNGELIEEFPVSMGMKGLETKNGTYYVLEKFPSIIMDSSTYGVPVNSPNGYKLRVQLAVRFDNSGDFVHSAPWSIDAQGERNVSHGCINLSPANAQWFFDNFGSGDPIVIKNSKGIYNQNDGAQDWQI